MPAIAKNLLSVLQLPKDNAIFIEFHGDCCFIKDKATGNTLLKGEDNDGLYRLEGATIVRNGESKGKQLVNINNTTTFTLTNISVNVTSRTVWHQCLGHPSSKVLNYILRGCNLSPKSKEEMFFFVIYVKWGSLMLFHFPNLCARH